MTTASHTTAHSNWNLGLQLGPAWFNLPLNREPDQVELAAQVDQRISREPHLADRRQKLIDMLAYFSRQAAQKRVTKAALRWAVDDHNRITAATLYLSSYLDNRFGHADRLLGFLRARMTPRHGSDHTDPDVEVRDLPAGRAVRVQVISNPDFAPAKRPSGQQSDPVRRRDPLVETVQYWLPVPGDNVVAVLTFATPNLSAARPLVAELDHIIDNLRITT